MIKVEQFVMAYKAEQDRLRAMIPEGFESLRPVLRINGEIRKVICGESEQEELYLEFNTPVEGHDKRGWLNVANWKTPETEMEYERNGSAVTFKTPFLEITYTGVGIEGGCPAERDNDGCFFLNEDRFRPNESIGSNKEFCDCSFQWKFREGDAHGISIGGKSIAAIPTEPEKVYERQQLTAENAAAIECEQILGSYRVAFEREEEL